MLRSFAVVIVFSFVLVDAHDVSGRGFGGGGFHGGGFHGGGYGGGFHGGEMGGFRGGDAGGFRGGEAGGFRGGDAGGFRGGEAGGFRGGEAGGFRGGEAGGFRGGAAPSRSDLNRFLGMPSDGGMHSISTSRSAGASVTGPRGNTVDRGAAVGPNGGVAAGRSAVGPGGAGVAQGVAAGPGGRVAAGGVARGPEGAVAGRGVVAGRYGAVGGFGYMSPSARYGAAYGVRAGFGGYGLYTSAWYGAHPGAWVAAGLTAAAWNAASWNTMNGWFGTSAAPIDYDYGSNVVTQDDSVYVDGQDAGTTQAYYEQAADLAKAGADAPATDDQNWLPLGVFAMTHGDQANSNMVIQLAVNKQGIIRGNFTDTKTNQTLSVQGSVDKKTQRAAWTIGDKKNEVIDTGMYNLTKDEVPALLHYGNDRTEQWLLVRVKQKDQQPSQN